MTIVETSTQEPTFAALAPSPTARLVRAHEAPDLSELEPGDMVICDERTTPPDYVSQASAQGINVRLGRYRVEDERIATSGRRRAVTTEYIHVLASSGSPIAGRMFDPRSVEASSDAFARTWDTLSAPLDTATPYSDAREHLPAEWAHYLPFPTLNPAQVQAAPTLVSDRNAVVVAPTGAGKTVIGMIAALREIVSQGGKAAWLVPQRSLTAELDRELDHWRAKGLRIATLSGDRQLDSDEARSADLWVSTTEKFEALCRASSMRDAIAAIGTLVVDEIHLLGEPGRGPTLEALLARVRGEDAPVRIVGLSATVANADEVATWLGADLVTLTWRPTRQTHQVVALPSGSRQDEDRWRNSATIHITEEVTRDGGSVLVFCGTKNNVRATALALAAARGVDVRGISHSDTDAVHRATQAARIGLHYSDWPHKSAAEADFRDRSTDVLVATSTLAAGVNTPARAVIVRDTTIGPAAMEVSMIQQMFGRAGRAGHEPEGWAFLLATIDQISRWRQRLNDGYTILSGILKHTEDHLLSEIVQRNVRTQAQALQWWRSTLAHHQGKDGDRPIGSATESLAKWHFVEDLDPAETDPALRATPLGALTSKMMVSTRDAASLLHALTRMDTPANQVTAENAMVETLTTALAVLANAPDVSGDQALGILRIVEAGGDARRLAELTARPRPSGREHTRAQGSTVMRAGLLLAMRSPRTLAGQGRDIAGVPRSLFNPVLMDTPRYLAWLAACGPLGAIPAWAAVVANDMAKRLAWLHVGPERGDGRLLATCEAISGRDRAAAGALYAHLRGENRRDVARLTVAHLPAPSRSAAAVLGALVPTPVAGRPVRLPAGAAAFSHHPDKRWRRLGAGGDAAPLTVVFGPRGDVAASGWLGAFTGAR